MPICPPHTINILRTPVGTANTQMMHKVRSDKIEKKKQSGSRSKVETSDVYPRERNKKKLDGMREEREKGYMYVHVP